MCDLSKFIIDLQELWESEETFSFRLDDEYFAAMDATDVRGGEVETTVKVSRAAGCFEVVFSSVGRVMVECSRCLDPISLPINTSDKLYVKLGEDYKDEGDEMVFIPESAPKLDLSWHIYEFIALAIPAQHSHPEGECNREMLGLLHGTTTLSDDNPEAAEENIDPRWAKLKLLKTDN